MKYFLFIFGLLWCTLSFAQKEFHVFPKNYRLTPGTTSGNGSIHKPWDLQHALNQPTTIVNGGDTIWLHEGVYDGRYISTLQSTIPNKFITVAAFKDDNVIINGNIPSKLTSVIEIKGKQVIFKDLEITFLGKFSRNQTETNFQKVDGVNHSSGAGCKFINLIIHNNPGSGFGSWKRTADTEINGCIIFNNGYYSAKRGSGVGIYVQNSAEKFRLIKNNTIFNNYYKGIEVWSDNRKATEAYVKNIILDNNVIFNSALVTGIPKDNLIIATNDNTSVNIAKHIKVLNNIFYHNTDYAKNEIDGESPSLTLGFNKNSPVEDITLTGNIILGRNDGIRILHAKSLTFKNNTVYSGFIRFYNSFYSNFSSKAWDFAGNSYYTRKSKTIRIQSKEDFTIEEWQKKYGMDSKSTWKPISEFNLNNVLNITQNEYDKNKYRIVLFSKNEEDVIVDFSNYKISRGTTYTIKDVEDYSNVLKTGILGKDKKITFPMYLNKGNKNKTLDNFGVFVLEFSNPQNVGLLGRLFGWIF
jgi:parallel beta-helix repeat protein